MKDLIFWLRWKRSYRALYVALLILFVLSIVAAGLAYIYGDTYTIGWTSTGEWKNITLALDVFDINQFSIQQESQQYLLQQRYVPGDVTIHPWISYAYLAAVMAAFILILTVISYLEIWLYVFGMGLFMLFLVTMHTEQLGIFGMYNRIPLAISLLFFCGLTFYFNAYGKHISLFVRIGLIKILTLAFALLLFYGSSIDYPILYASNYSITIPIILSIIFMLIVGYDFMQFLVVVTSYGRSEYKTSGNSIWNFIIIGGLYLTNLFIVYFKPAFIGDLDLVFIQPFIVLAISAIIGIWMFAYKPEVTDNIPFNPLGAILFLALGIITFATIALGYITSNDALITTLETSALYIQIGMGLGIFLYVIINFWNKYKKQEEVYKIFHTTYQVPFFVGRSVGWAIIMYFFFSANSFVYKSSLAAYYNHVGDVYLFTEQNDLAKSHYEEAYTYEFQNQRTSYTLGNFYQKQNDKNNSFEYLQACLNKNPTPYAYAGLSTFYINNDQLFPAMFMLKDGLQKYPNNPYLLNNIGYLYTLFEQIDSSAYFYSKALEYTTDEIPAANLLAYYGSKGNFTKCDTIINTYKNNSSVAYLANKIGISTMSGIKNNPPIEIPASIVADTLIDAYSYTFLYNYAFNKLDQQDSLLHKILDRYIQNPENEFYKANLMYAKAIQLYYSQTNIPAALSILDELVHTNQTPLYVITLADLQLKAGLHEEAAETYKLLVSYPDQRMVAYRCLATFEGKNKSDVHETLNELSKSLNPQSAEIAKTLLQAERNPTLEIYKGLSDKEKVQCLHYHTLSPAEYIQYRNVIQDSTQSVLFDIQVIKNLNKKKEYASAMSVWNNMSKPESVPASIIAEANLEYLQILAGLQQWEAVQTEAEKISLLHKDEGYRDYFLALSEQHSKDSAQALSHYQAAIAKVGYSEQVQIDFAKYIAATKGDVDALEQLVNAKKIILYSTPLSLAYIDVCLRLGLYKSAEDELNEIRSDLTDQQIDHIKSRFYMAQASQ